MASHKALTTLLLLSTITYSSAFLQCYFPDGTLATDYEWVACYDPLSPPSPSTHAPCCIPSEGDICQDSGLCFYPGADIDRLFRGACTDPTFQDPACPQICTDNRERNETWVWIEKCVGEPYEWQCGGLEGEGHQWAACNDPDKEFMEFEVLTTRTEEMSAPTTFLPKEGPPTNTVTPTPDPVEEDEVVDPNPPPSKSSKKLSTGAIVGIAIGGAAVLLLAVAAFFILRFRSNAKQSAAPSHQPNHTTNNGGDMSQYQPAAGFGQHGQDSGGGYWGAAPSYQPGHTGSPPFQYQNPQYAAHSTEPGVVYNSGYGGGGGMNELGGGGENKAPYHMGVHEIGGNTVVPGGLAGAATEQRVAEVGDGNQGVLRSQTVSPPVELPGNETQRYT